MASWGEILFSRLIEIAKQIIKIFNEACVGVYTAWSYTAAPPDNPKVLRDPFLMLAPKKKKRSRVCKFFNLSTEKIHKINLKETGDNRFFSSKGFLLMIRRNYNVKILHPYSSSRIRLPNIKSIVTEGQHTVWYDRAVYRFLLSSNPLMDPDYTVIIITYLRYKMHVYYVKSGDENWTLLTTCNSFDLTFYKPNQLYMIEADGYLKRCDFGGTIEDVMELPVPHEEMEEDPKKLYETRYYIVKCGEDLIVIARIFEEDIEGYMEKVDGVYHVLHNEPGGYGSPDYRTVGFRLFKIDLEKMVFREVKDIGRNTIFVGYNSTLCIEAEETTCEPNSVYFTDDYWGLHVYNKRGGGKDMGIYKLGNGEITPHYKGRSLHVVTPPMWVERY